MAEHELSAQPTHSRWNRRLPPRLRVAPGDIVHFECLDSSGSQVRPAMRLAEFLNIDRGRIHALTGPVFVEGAEPGDVLGIEILEVAHKGWGWSSVIGGLGFLKERFAEPFLFHWELDESETRSLEPAVVPLRPFCGVLGVAPAEEGEFRTRPPGNFGGNMDVRELASGATLYLPVMNAGALFSAGDAHAAQGDGEVCINGIECPAAVSLRFQLHKKHALRGPMLETVAIKAVSGAGEWIVVESAPDAVAAARAATSRMIDLLVSRWGFQDIHAYLLCSVAMNLRWSQVVNEPIFTVSAGIAKSVLPPRKLFPSAAPGTCDR
ncbi:MAG: acetamidase/formamidase family protein [Candidatus Acidiferrum sp.]|jgi:acetamidase/formamidase